MTASYDPPAGRHAASSVLSAARARADTPKTAGPRYPQTRPPMSVQRRQDVAEQFAKGDFCAFCGRIHAGLSTPGCPRVAACEMDGDGKVRSIQFWPDGEWDTSGTYSAADVETDDEPS